MERAQGYCRVRGERGLCYSLADVSKLVQDSALPWPSAVAGQLRVLACDLSVGDPNINNIGLNKCINKQRILEDDTLAARGHKGEKQKFIIRG